MKYDPKKTSISFGGVNPDGTYQYHNRAVHDFEPVRITVRAPEPDSSPPAHLLALSVTFCPLCGFRFVRPSANTCYLPPGPRYPYRYWFSFYRCSCCDLYYLAYRCQDAELDARIKDDLLAVCKLPRPKYGQGYFERNNRNITEQLGERMSSNTLLADSFWAEGVEL